MQSGIEGREPKLAGVWTGKFQPSPGQQHYNGRQSSDGAQGQEGEETPGRGGELLPRRAGCSEMDP